LQTTESGYCLVRRTYHNCISEERARPFSDLSVEGAGAWVEKTGSLKAKRGNVLLLSELSERK
jgi:hypothetical protein